MLREIFLSFIPIFVAMDVVGVLPIFVSLTRGMEKRQRRLVILESILTASGLAVGFIFLGRAVFNVLGITVNDFMIAGGAILFCLAVIDIIFPFKQRRRPGEKLGAVPLGTPLMVGPAVLTTSLIVISQYGILATLISVIGNVMLAGLVFSFSGLLSKILGQTGADALSKITSLLLAAIAVMMIRKGIIGTIEQL